MSDSTVPQHRNEVHLTGLLARDPSTKFTATGKKLSAANICVALSSKTKTFIRVVAWEGLADLLERLHQGAFVEVQGRIQSRSWDGADGRKQTITEVVLNKITTYTDETTNTRLEAGEDGF